MKRRVSLEAQDQTIRRMAADGCLAREMSVETGAAEGSIRRYIRRHNIPWVPDRTRWSERGSACSRHHTAVKAMAEAGATLEMIAEVVGTSRHVVRRYLDRHSIERPAWRQPPGDHPMSRNTRGPNNPAWNGGRILDKDGYVLLWMPGHPEANRHGYVREHRIVMARSLGRPLRPEEVVDHRNDVRDDNRPENLRLFASNGEHLSVTLTGRKSRASRGLPPSNRKPKGTGGRP